MSVATLNTTLRTVLWIAFFAAVLAAWWAIFGMARGMGMDLLGRPGPDMQGLKLLDPLLDLCVPVAAFWPILWMWVVMMAAMMLPTLVPTLRTYESLMVSADGSQGGWLGIVAGYGLVWVIGAVVFAGLQLGLMKSGIVDMLGAARHPVYAGAFLMLAGAYQFSVVKEACQNVCMHPMTYFMGNWRTGTAGGLRMGLGLGAYCVGCCWAIMALGFVGGVMSPLWMGLATLFMVVEKLPQIGRYVTGPMGVALVGAGMVAIGAGIFTGG